MKLETFCNDLAEMFDKDRFDVSTGYYREPERHKYAFMIITCKSCHMYVTEYIGYKADLWFRDSIFRLAKRMKKVLETCDCWQTATLVEPEEKKIKQKQQVRRKIRV